MLSVAMCLCSCGEKKKASTQIITHKPQAAKTKTIHSTGDYSQSMPVEWLGTKYTVSVSRKADSTLPIVTNTSGDKYYDNAITVRIVRPDSTEFFAKTFHKTAFSGYLDADFEKQSTLLGIVFDKAEGNNIYFAASVGDPDHLSDEYVPLTVSISNLGAVAITKATELMNEEE